ncbi:SHOCT domain-containing protein [Brevibacillus reuszeri]|uniref:SHOCT domain-containing protein n=1 Tax=Brevibacillus reuszeri TaxID=54915 RepID=UPI000CCC2EBA|nr:SHOCT domain-containing protein [Brevibacillus reuszeri]
MSKLYQRLLEKVSKADIVDWAEGVNGILAVTKSHVYIIRGNAFEKKTIKTYSLKSISSVQTRKPNLLTRGHIQIITSGVGDRTGAFSSSFNYALDENSVMISNNFDHFVRLEQLVYKLQSQSEVASSITINEAPQADDVFTKIEKLSELRNKSLITEEEYEAKRTELLSQI